jgi:hypothetical protein
MNAPTVAHRAENLTSTGASAIAVANALGEDRQDRVMAFQDLIRFLLT